MKYFFIKFTELLGNQLCANTVDLGVPGPEAEFKEFERRLEFKPRLKYGWFHLKLYSMFQDLSRR